MNCFQPAKLTVINTWWGGRPCCQKQFWFGSIEPHFELKCHSISVSLAVSRFRPQAGSMLEDCSNWKFEIWKDLLFIYQIICLWLFHLMCLDRVIQKVIFALSPYLTRDNLPSFIQNNLIVHTVCNIQANLDLQPYPLYIMNWK